MNPRITDWTGQRVWIIGASTGIGAETARQLLKLGARVALSARNGDALRRVAGDDENAFVVPFDMTDRTSTLAARACIRGQWGSVDLTLIIAGAYNEMRADQFDMAAANRLIDVNLCGVLHCVEAALPALLKNGCGGIGIVSSVAGYSGLPKALIYGATKAALINFSESLYLDLGPRGIAVYLINPGFVDTPLTADNEFPMPALISAETAASEIIRGIERGQFHIHFPKRFTNCLRIARLLPYRIYFWLIHKVTGL